ncbi:MAG: cytidylate kinase-like family protein [Verrucomicrobiales bacterium]|nr:cytidylate kinase-like family protein [Verrucomicrobiales bacterium]
MMTYLRGQLAETGPSAEQQDRAPSLTISRQCGSGTSRIGRALVEYLDEVDESAIHGWAFFDQSLIGKIIEENLLPETADPYALDQAKFPISPLLQETLDRPRSEWCLFNHCASTIRSLSRMGNAVIAGRAANFVTSDHPNTFHVRLVGSEAKRIAYTRNRFEMTNEEAEKLVRKTDQSRARFVRRYTGMEVDDPSAYHLILNTDNLRDEVIVRIIGDSLIEWANERGPSSVSRGHFSQAISEETVL